MAGHMSDKKTRALLRRNYTWPGVSRDVAEWCKACRKCQLVKKTPPPRVPLQPMPIVSEPFHVLAFDIVGPFERSRQGYKYVLTALCLVSKYPEAIPLKDIRAETVAEGMLEIFSRTRIPKKLLTDQGQQFIGKLNKQLCQRLQIQKLRTSAYHPQTNGCLERWHGTLVPMIKKSIVNKFDWDKQVKLALCAYRCAPHSNTGFSPFEISPWSSPIVPVKKPDGTIRLCIDFRKLNAVTTLDPYCMQLIEDLLDQVSDCEYLSKLDLSKGFYQIPIDNYSPSCLPNP